MNGDRVYEFFAREAQDMNSWRETKNVTLQGLDRRACCIVVNNTLFGFGVHEYFSGINYAMSLRLDNQAFEQFWTEEGNAYGVAAARWGNKIIVLHNRNEKSSQVTLLDNMKRTELPSLDKG